MANTQTGKFNHRKTRISESPITTLVLQNIEAAERVQHKMRYYGLSTAISNAIHEICAQYTIMAHLIVSLNVKDQKKVAKALNIDLSTCKTIADYLKGMENISEAQRVEITQWVETTLLTPLINEFLKKKDNINAKEKP